MPPHLKYNEGFFTEVDVQLANVHTRTYVYIAHSSVVSFGLGEGVALCCGETEALSNQETVA
jgi:hypothetical protein